MIILLCFLGLVTLLAFVVTLILLAPLKIAGDITWTDADKNGRIDLSWIHPLLCRARIDFGKMEPDWRFLFWRGGGGEKAEEGRKKAGRRQKEGREERQPEAEPEEGEMQRSPEAGREEVEIQRSPVAEREKTEASRSSEAGREGREEHRAPAAEPGAAKSGGEKTKEPTPDAETGRTGSKQKKNSRFAGIVSGLRGARQLYRTISAHHLQRKMLRWAGRSLRWTLRIIRFKRLNVTARVGLEDPASTGILYGQYTALHHFLLTRRNLGVDLRLEPRFNEQAIDVEAHIRLKTSLGRMLLPALVAIATAPYWSIWMVWRELKKKAKEEEKA